MLPATVRLVPLSRKRTKLWGPPKEETPSVAHSRVLLCRAPASSVPHQCFSISKSIYIYIDIFVLSARVTSVFAFDSETRCRAGRLDCAKHQPETTLISLSIFFFASPATSSLRRLSRSSSYDPVEVATVFVVCLLQPHPQPPLVYVLPHIGSFCFLRSRCQVDVFFLRQRSLV